MFKLFRSHKNSLRRDVYYLYCTQPVESKQIKPFDEIPGPRGPLGLGNLYNYLPVIGKYSWLKLHKSGFHKYETYGSIVRETMAPGVNIVWIYDPNDIAVLLNDKDYPHRRSHLALEKYRTDRPHVYRSAGLIPTNGPEWWRLRSELQKELSAPKNVRSFLMDVDKITHEFLDVLPVQSEFNLLPELARLNLELTCLLTFDERLNAFSPEEHQPNSRTSKLIKSTETTNSCILPTDQGLQLWRYFETPTYKKLRKAQNYMESVAVDLVAQKLAYFKEENTQQLPGTGSLTRSSLIEEYLKNPNLDLSDVVGMASDLLLAGVDTTSYSTSFAVYHIARHPEIQEKLYQEAKTIMPNVNDSLTGEALRTGITYTRAVLKESFRLNPVSVGFGRVLKKDIVLSGYHVPAGTIAVTQNMIASRLEKHFERPNEFDPQRWLQRKTNINPYVVLPFGHGMRSCIARRMAEQSILVFLLKLVRRYKIEWKGVEDLDVRTLLINKPEDPVSVVLEERS
ncbi:cytochrome P450 302a1, mitochondrial [Episyrphus balteatus]|uniref:cytochrome P450 302a1, mitochondrial n=1 Tax=Episyrphus balteatus TaxID=286459 RepID=UPI002485B2F6|nr:cytochrome P450 302a1, mitochondrial [Episyrphus balteatus]